MENKVRDINADIVNLVQNSSIFGDFTKDIDKSKISLTHDIDIVAPPLPNKIALRSELIDNISEELESIVFLNIKGEIGAGKTQLCNILVSQLDREVFWFRIREYKTQLKSLLTELSIIINKKGFQPLKYFSKKLDIPKNSIIVLDDLPDLSGLDIVSELKILIDICDTYNIKIISSSNTLISHNITQYLDKFSNYPIPVFSDNDTTELLKIYGAPSSFQKVIKLINSFSDGHPSLIIATINYFESVNWNIDFGKFLNNKFVDDELKYFQILFEETIKDKSIRELAYRLNNIGRVITEEDIKLVSSINPIVVYPFEKIITLLDTWIYKESEKEYLLSPVLYKLGSKNLDIKVEKNINNRLGLKIFTKKILNEYEIMKGMLYLIKAEEYDTAGFNMTRILHSIIDNEEIKESNVPIACYFWVDNDFPTSMDIGLQVLIRGLQIIVYNKFEKDATLLYGSFLELEKQLPEKQKFMLLLPYSMFSLHKCYHENITTKIFNIVNTLPGELKSQMISKDSPSGLTIENYAVLNIESLDSYNNLYDWLGCIKKIDLKELNKTLNVDFGEDVDFMSLVTYKIKNDITKKSDSSDIDKVYLLLIEFTEYMYSKSFEQMWIYLIVCAIDCLIKLEKLNEAIKLRNKYIELTENIEYKLLINNEISMRLVDKEKYEDALELYKYFDDCAIIKLTTLNMYVYSAISFANTNNYSNAKLYFEKALEFDDINILDDLYRARILGEYSILLFEMELHHECIEVCEQIILLINEQKELCDHWKTIYLILGNHIGYFSSILINNKLPDNDTSAIPKSRSYLYTSPNSGLLESYDNTKKCFIYYHMYNMYSYLDDKTKVIEYLSKSYDSSHLYIVDDLKKLILIDYYLFNDNFTEYLELVYDSITEANTDILIMRILSPIIRLNILKYKEENRIEEFKKIFIQIFNDDIVDKKYTDTIIYVLNNLNGDITNIEKENDWITQRFELLYKVNDMNLLKVIEVHSRFNNEFFIGEYSAIFSELQKRLILEDYFFNFWLFKLDNESEEFKYTSNLKDAVEELYGERLQPKEKISKLLKLIAHIGVFGHPCRSTFGHPSKNIF